VLAGGGGEGLLPITRHTICLVFLIIKHPWDMLARLDGDALCDEGVEADMTLTS